MLPGPQRRSARFSCVVRVVRPCGHVERKPTDFSADACLVDRDFVLERLFDEVQLTKILTKRLI